MTEPHIRKVRPDEIDEVWRVHVNGNVTAVTTE